MMQRNTVVFLGMGLLSGALVLGSTAMGCQSGTNTTSSTSGTGGGNGGSGSTSTSTGTSTSSGMTSTSSSGSGGGGTGFKDATIQELTNGTYGPDIAVKLTGVVAMSHKFLVSKSNSGSCLWGAFVSDPNVATTAKNTGMMVISYGTPAMVPEGGSTAYCPVIEDPINEPAGDALPDDLKPGDVLDLSGKTSSFAPSTCAPGTVKQLQLRVDPGNAPRTGTGHARPAPYVMSAAEVTEYASQTPADANLYRDWGGVLVRVQNVTATPQGGSITNMYGQMFMAGSNLQVGDKLYYQGLLNSLGQVCHSGPVYANASQSFTSIDGFLFLDFCTWSLAPACRCESLQPPPDDCTGLTCCQ